MSTRRPRRRRRRDLPAPELPRPGQVRQGSRDEADAGLMRGDDLLGRRPVHHITRDYKHVRSDLLLVAGVSAVTVAFVVAMAFIV